jgi:hypothetical protein
MTPTINELTPFSSFFHETLNLKPLSSLPPSFLEDNIRLAVSGKVPISSGADEGNLLSKISSQNSINSLTRSCRSFSSFGSDKPWSSRDEGREVDATDERPELGRGRGGASEGRQV